MALGNIVLSNIFENARWSMLLLGHLAAMLLAVKLLACEDSRTLDRAVVQGYHCSAGPVWHKVSQFHGFAYDPVDSCRPASENVVKK